MEAYFADAGLKAEHDETLSKEMEFEPWADRMSVSAETKAKLIKWLDDAPGAACEWLAPRRDGGKLLFALHEVILVGKKA